MSSVCCFASASQSLNIWEFQNKNELSLKISYEPIHGSIADLSWSHTNAVIACAMNTKIDLIHSQQGNLISSIPFNEIDVMTEGISSLAFSANSRFIGCGSGPWLYLWDLKRKNLKSKYKSRQDITDICFLSDGDIVSGDRAGAIRIWDVKTNVSSSEMLLGDETIASSNPSSINDCVLQSMEPLSVKPNEQAIEKNMSLRDIKNIVSRNIQNKKTKMS